MILEDIFMFIIGLMLGALAKYASILFGVWLILNNKTDTALFWGMMTGLVLASGVNVDFTDKTEVIIKCDKENQKDSV